MEKKRLFAMLTLIAGVMLVFALSGCKDPPPQGTWQETNIEITGTWSGDTISFTYNGSPGTITRNGGGTALDGVWNGTFQGDTVKVTVSGSNWTMEVLDNGKYVEYAKGTVTNSSGALTIIVTHVMDYGDEVYESIPGPGGTGGPSGTPLESSQIWSQLRDTKWIKEGATNSLPSIGFYSAHTGPLSSNSNAYISCDYISTSSGEQNRMSTGSSLYVLGGGNIIHQDGSSFFHFVLSDNILNIFGWNENDSHVPSEIMNGAYDKDVTP